MFRISLATGVPIRVTQRETGNGHRLHFLMTEGGVDEAGLFYKVPRIDDSRLAEIFARGVLRLLVGKGLLNPEWAERVGKYMVRPVLSLEPLIFLEGEGKVGYRWGRPVKPVYRKYND
jgi:hypothetical protein